MAKILLPLVLTVVLGTSVCALPFVVLHGIGDQCRNSGMESFTTFLSTAAHATGFCIEIGNGASDSFFMPMSKQVEAACASVKAIPELSDGYNIVGLSQGNLVGRGLIEWCDGGPPVRNFVSIGGPHAGTASVPACSTIAICILVDAVIKLGVYTAYVQNHLAPAGYVKIPTDLKDYYKGCLFLPKLNNELPASRNSTYRDRMASLHRLVLIMFKADTVLIPAETAWFGYFGDNDFNRILQPQDTDLYIQDWIGLRALDEADRVTYVALPGNHLDISQSQLLQFVVPSLSEREEFAGGLSER